MLKHASHDISNSDISSVVKVLKSEFITQGPEINKLENKISSFVKSKFSSVTNSSTSALFLACLALGLKKNDIVWTSAITFVASSNCAIYCGAHVDLVDISLDDYNIDVYKLEQKLIKTPKKKLPKILVVVHFAGNSCDMKKIYSLSKKYKFKIIEDACHAFGGFYENTKIGSCKYSDLSTFSFHAIKNISSGEGGAITTNKMYIKKKIDYLKSHGIQRKSKNVSWLYDQKYLGYNFRLTDFQSALANNQINRIKKILKKKYELAKIYMRHLDRKVILVPKIEKNSGLHLFIIRIHNLSIKKKIKFTEILKKKYKIFVNFHYIPIYRHTYYKNKFNYNKKKFLRSELYYNTALSLPFHTKLKKRDCIYISNCINSLAKDVN